VNILDNAVKFTPSGGKISISAVQDDSGFVVVKVTDTGMGIQKSEIPRLGERILPGGQDTFERVGRHRFRIVNSKTSHESP
jgi:signal transduction histidine kinase